MPSRKSSKSGRIFCAPPCKKASRTRPCSAPFAPARKPGPSAGTRFSNASPALREHHLPRSFDADLSAITDAALLRRIRKVIEQVKAARTFQQIPNLKRLEASGKYYRIRLGEYR